MNEFLKRAYDLGSKAALEEVGIVKESEMTPGEVQALGSIPSLGYIAAPLVAAYQSPEGRGWSRFGHMAAGQIPGAMGGGLVGSLLGRFAGPVGRVVGSGLGFALGSGYGGRVGYNISQDHDPIMDRLSRGLE